MSWMKWILAAWLLASCSPVATCAQTCAGCCTERGVCVPGTATDACGAAGALCTNCVVRHSNCVAQQCVLSPDGGGGGTTGGGGGAATGGGGGAATGGGGAATGGGGAATGGGGGSTSDAGNPYRFWDGGSCAVKNDCPCFSSEDCGPGFFCRSEDSSGLNVFCIPGARGVGAVGASCVGESDCASALCVEASDGGKGCSGLCESITDCVPSLPRCTYIGFGIDRSICSP